MDEVTASMCWKVFLCLLVPLLIGCVISDRIKKENESRRHGIRRPPSAPYWVPGVGNTAGFAFDTEKFLASIMLVTGRGFVLREGY